MRSSRKFKFPTFKRIKTKSKDVNAEVALPKAHADEPVLLPSTAALVATKSASDVSTSESVSIENITSRHFHTQRTSDPLLGGLSERQLYDQAIIREYDEASDTLRKFILLNHNDAQRAILYARYLQELEDAINAINDNELKKLARDVLDQVKFAHEHVLQKYDGYKVDDLQLFDVLHSTAKLISTPLMTNEGKISDSFILSGEKFRGVMNGIRSDGHTKALSLAGYALLTSLVLLAGIMIGVLTFGASVAATLTASVLIFGIINMSGQFGFGVYTGMKAVGLFNQSYRQIKIANRMEALETAIKAGTYPVVMPDNRSISDSESESQSDVSSSSPALN